MSLPAAVAAESTGGDACSHDSDDDDDEFTWMRSSRPDSVATTETCCNNFHKLQSPDYRYIDPPHYHIWCRLQEVPLSQKNRATFRVESIYIMSQKRKPFDV